MPRGTRCKAHKHTAIVAEENHHLQPLSRGGLTTSANMRYLCANAHSDTHYLLDLIEKFAGPLIGSGAEPDRPISRIPWEILRSYGPGIRDAALTGWNAYGPAYLRGEYRRHAALWLTSGQPRSRTSRRVSEAVEFSIPSYGYAADEGLVDRLLDSVRL